MATHIILLDDINCKGKQTSDYADICRNIKVNVGGDHSPPSHRVLSAMKKLCEDFRRDWEVC